MKKLVFIAMIAVSVNVHADVNKCTGANGKVTYQEGPCEQGAAGAKIKIVNPVLSSTPDQDLDPADVVGLSQIKSIYLSPSSVKTSTSAKKDGMKVTVMFKNDKDKSVRLKGFDNIRYSAMIYEEKDGKRGSTLGSGSGKLDDDYGHYFIIKVSAREKTRVLIEASVILPDGRRFESKDTTTFFPDPL